MTGHTTLLHCAAAKGDAAQVQELLRAAGSQAAPLAAAHDALGRTPLHCAAAAGALAAAHLLLQANPGAALAEDAAGWLPCHHAAAQGRRDLVLLLLAAEPSSAAAAERQGRLPLHLAMAGSGSKALAAVLLEACPAAAAAADAAGRLPLHVAAASGRAAVVQLLLEAYPAGATTADQQGQLPCHEAAKGGTVHSLAALLEAAPAAASTPDSQGRLPLQHAAQASWHTGILRLLLPASPPQAQRWLLHRAVAESRLRTVRLVLSAAPAAVCMADPTTGSTALHVAASVAHKRHGPQGRQVLAALLEAAPALAGTKDELGRLPLHLALSSHLLPGSAAAVRLLLQAHPAAASVPAGGDQQRLPLQQLLEEGRWGFGSSKEVVQLLLAAAPVSISAAASSTDSGGRTLAHLVAAWGLEAPVQQLVGAAPALLMAADSRGALPTHYAASAAQPACLQLLLDAAPQTALSRDGEGLLPIHAAAGALGKEPGRVAECVQLLLAVGDADTAAAAAAAADARGRLPLQHAMHSWGAEVAALLLAAAPHTAASVVDQPSGRTALHWAVAWQRPDLVCQVLEAAPGLVSTADSSGQLPLQLAVSSDGWLGGAPSKASVEVARLLLAATPAASTTSSARHEDSVLGYATRAGSTHSTATAQLERYPTTTQRRAALGDSGRPAQEQWHMEAQADLLRLPCNDVAPRWQLHHSSSEASSCQPASCAAISAAPPAAAVPAGKEVDGAGQVMWRLAQGGRHRLRFLALHLARAQRVLEATSSLAGVWRSLGFATATAAHGA